MHPYIHLDLLLPRSWLHHLLSLIFLWTSIRYPKFLPLTLLKVLTLYLMVSRKLNLRYSTTFTLVRSRFTFCLSSLGASKESFNSWWNTGFNLVRTPPSPPRFASFSSVFDYGPIRTASVFYCFISYLEFSCLFALFAYVVSPVMMSYHPLSIRPVSLASGMMLPATSSTGISTMGESLTGVP